MQDEATFSRKMERLQRSPRKKEVLQGILHGKSDKDIAEALGIHEGTVRKQISLICEIFGLQRADSRSKRADLVSLFAKYKPDWLGYLETNDDKPDDKKQIQLAEAPDVRVFYGRLNEIEKLQKWLLEDECQLVSICGFGGIGKSTLASKLASQKKIQDEFDYIFWINLNEVITLETVIEEVIKFLSPQTNTQSMPSSINEKIAQLLHFFRSQSCLLILDNFESTLQRNEFREPYELLLKRVGESKHASCLIITTRENPEEITKQEGQELPVRKLLLEGLTSEDAGKILTSKGVAGTEHEIEKLVKTCSGNPLALKILATQVKDLFDGEIKHFIKSSREVPIFLTIENLLKEQFEKISENEKNIMYWLAINNEASSINDLLDDIKPSLRKSSLIAGLQNLNRCSLINAKKGKFALQPIVMEYVFNDLIEKITEEIKSKNINLFSDICLKKANAKDYIRDLQTQSILLPIIENLKGLSNIDQRLIELLDILNSKKKEPLANLGYAAGNIISLLQELDIDFSDFKLDFSGLPVWQAYLKGQELHKVSFAHSDLQKSVFSQTFGTVLVIASHSKTNFWATGDTNNEIRLWQGNNQQIKTFIGHTNWIRSIAFSPDGKMIASASDDQTVKVWDIGSGQCIKTFECHNERVWSVDFSNDSNLLASGGEDGLIIIYDVQKFQILHQLEGHTNWTRSVCFSPTQTILASVGDNKVVKIWDTKTAQCRNTLKGHTNFIRSVTFSPDGQTLASSGEDKTIKLWNIEQENPLLSLSGHTNWVRSVAFSPDGQTLASSGEDKTIKLWNINTGECIKTLEGHNERIWSLTFLFNGSVIISGSDDKTIKLWNVFNGKCIKTLEGYTNWAWSVDFSHDGQLLVSGNEDKTVRVWNIPDEKCIRTLRGHTNRIRTVALSPNGKTLASGSDDGNIKLWNIQTGLCTMTLEEHADRVLSVSFSPDNRTLASAGDDRIIRIWDSQTGQCLQKLQGHNSWVWSLEFSPDGLELASGSEDKTVKLWEIDTGQCLNTLTEHSSWVRAVAFSPDGKTLASAGEDRTVKLWRVSNGQCLNSNGPFTEWIRTIAFSPDGKKLAIAGAGKKVTLLDIKTNQHYSLHDHNKRIWSVAFSRNGTALASGSEDGTIRLWDLEKITPSESRAFKILRARRLYEGLNITGIEGLTDIEVSDMLALGAVKDD